MFTFRSFKYNLRGSNILDRPKRNTTTYGLYSFIYLTAKLRNSLPDNSVGCLWQATVSLRVNFFFIFDAKRQS